MSEVLKIANRFAARFRWALDELAFPSSLAERVHRVSIALDTHNSTAMSLLAGEAMPDYETLFAICTLTNKQPGYFLDANLPDSDFSQVKVVQPIGSGPPIAMEMNERLIYPSYITPATLFWYFTAYEDLPLNIMKGDLVITTSQAKSCPPIIKGRHYVIADNGDIKIFECLESTPSSAFLRGMTAERESKIISVTKKVANARADQEHHFGLLIGILRGHLNLHPSTI